MIIVEVLIHHLRTLSEKIRHNQKNEAFKKGVLPLTINIRTYSKF